MSLSVIIFDLIAWIVYIYLNWGYVVLVSPSFLILPKAPELSLFKCILILYNSSMKSQSPFFFKISPILSKALVPSAFLSASM